MKDAEMDDVAALWEQVRATGNEQPKANIKTLIEAGQARKKKTLAAHYGNAAVLSATVVVLMFYFYYLYSFQDMLSKIGYNLMIGGLVIRIAVELFSVWRSRKIKVSDTAAASLQNTVSFLKFRKHIHGPVTIIILVVYFIGFYMLTPEFSRHFSTFWMIALDAGALVIAVLLTLMIRKGIKQELHHLEKIVELQRSLVYPE
ncbi:MAG: hypothetical protein KIT62_06720 [Cyclobacteriaceae bacterium]|nr:hypothetical protein [Cyclobacteriaceae bacterium]